MNTNYWIKQTNIKLFGIKIFQKEEICTDKSYEGEIVQVNISPEYYNDEFKVDKNKDNNC